MLPSTGYFKTINCPFYENGSCERPYCHFKHLRKEDVSNSSTSSSSSSGVTNVNVDKTDKNENKGEVAIPGICESPAPPAIAATNPEMIQKLVTDAVNKVLADQCVTDKEKMSENIVSKVVEGLKPTLAPALAPTIAPTIGRHTGVPQLISKPPCVYNPTPIAELKKRHIPVPVYMPTRDNKIPVKRKSTDELMSASLTNKPEAIKSSCKELTYKPTAIVNNSAKDIQNYVPTVKLDNGSTNSSDIYYPKSKKRREEYVPRMIKTPLQLNESNLDQLEPESNMLDDAVVSNRNSENIEDAGGYFNTDEHKMDVDPTKEAENKNNENQCEIVYNSDDQSEKNNDNLQKSSSVNNQIICKEKDKSKKSEKSEHKNNSSSSRSSKSESKKDRSDRKSSSSNKYHSSSSSKHKDKNDHSKHSTKSNSSHSKTNSNGNSSSSSSKSSRSHRDKHSSSKENDRSHHKSSRRDKHKSSKSKDDKKNLSSKEKNHSNSRSSKSHRKSVDKELIHEKNESDHEDILLNNYINEEDILSSDSEHDVEEECLKIFQEYKASDHLQGVTTKTNESTKNDVEDVEEVGRKRIAHASAENSIRLTGVNNLAKKTQNPQQKMYERWRLMREAAAEKAAEKIKNDKDISSNNIKLNENSIKSLNNNSEVNGNGRIRIAPVSYAMSLTAEKKKIMESAAMLKLKADEQKTVAQTKKGGPRVAHIPQVVPQLVHPEPLAVSTQKFPINNRQYYVNLMHDCCAQIYPNSEDATQRALREELACHEKCKALAVYKSSCMLAIHRLKKEIEQGPSNSLAPSGSGMISHDAILAGKSKGSWSVIKTKKAFTNLKGPAFYSILKKWMMTDQQLKDNGFPRPHPQGPKGRAKIYAICTRNHSIISKVPNERNCSRCGKAYLVDKFGYPLKQENCIYHWGRKVTFRGEGKYTCCQQDGSASGCSDGRNHVWDHVDLDNLRGFVQTLPKNIAPEDQGVYSLDCEMCYTTQGLELTRVTVINEDCKVIYETLVKPENTIVDYNTRFSGITEENMAGVTTTLLEVQASLLAMFSDKTILIGHSLESDFKALKLIHNTVVDTSLVFPHKNGYPYKRALKNLCSEYLRKIIQNSVGGHDSNEDAISCMELMHWKVKEEAKLQ